MRILALTNLFPSPHQPTRGMFNLQAFEALGRICEVRVMAPVPWHERVRRPGELLRSPSLKSDALRIDYPSFWYLPRVAAGLQAGCLEASLLPRIARMRRSFPFDAVLAAWAYPDGVAAQRIAARFGTACATMVLGSDLNALAARPELRQPIAASLARTDRVITVSGALAERARELGVPDRRLRVQHNGVDGTRFRPRDPLPLRRKLGLEAGRRWVTYVGNLVPEKGADLLLRALAGLAPAERPHVALVGDGPSEPELRRLAGELGVEELVRFCGRRPFAEVPDWIAAGDVLCLPSRREGCPNVVLEALASGRPVAACAVGGVPEILSSHTGRLAAPEDPEALAVALREVLAHHWDPERLRASVPYLSWDAFAGSLYRELQAAVAERAC